MMHAARTAPVLRSATAAALLCFALGASMLSGCRERDQKPIPDSSVAGATPAQAESTYVGRARCAACHAEQEALWRGSHHDLAMQEPSADSVLGNFNDATFSYAGTTSRFFRRGGRYLVRTDGPDGRLQDYEIAYVFGFYPLQQYLIGFPDGRYQALGIAWDSRPKSAGGQRWFHLYPGEEVTHTDVLHWTKFSQSWNAQCASCHSTNLRKNFDRAADRYATTWSEIDVSCEACHGPGSAHVVWAERAARSGDRREVVDAASVGLPVDLSATRSRSWTIDAQTGSAVLSGPSRSGSAEVDVCAPCHARRSERLDGHAPGHPFLASYRPSFLSDGLYHADGQMQDEVYNYGSLLQSRMYAAGVTCSDCHDPHSLKVRAPGNALCTRCHLTATFDTPKHHFHKPGTKGSQCVDCHMPTETYMVVDPRHDHSFRVPRPDLTEQLGLPNACTSCHSKKSAAWASAEMDKRISPSWRQRPQFAKTFADARQGRAASIAGLVELASDESRPAIVRASAVELLQAFSPRTVGGALHDLADDFQPMVRLAIASAIRELPPADRARLGAALLDDPLRVIRLEAASALAGEPAAFLSADRRLTLDRLLSEVTDSEMFNGDRPESFLNLGLLHERRGDPARARAEYEMATRRMPWFVPARVNLAELQRRSGDESAADKTLRDGLAIVPDDPNLLYALGLSLIRQQRPDEATALFAQAARLAPASSRFAFAHALALDSRGKGIEALQVLERALALRPDDRDLLEAAASLAMKRGDASQAREYARRLLRVAPDDPAAMQLARMLGLNG